jgi:hypothetical protein
VAHARRHLVRRCVIDDSMMIALLPPAVTRVDLSRRVTQRNASVGFRPTPCASCFLRSVLLRVIVPSTRAPHAVRAVGSAGAGAVGPVAAMRSGSPSALPPPRARRVGIILSWPDNRVFLHGAQPSSRNHGSCLTHHETTGSLLPASA